MPLNKKKEVMSSLRYQTSRNRPLTSHFAPQATWAKPISLGAIRNQERIGPRPLFIRYQHHGSNHVTIAVCRLLGSLFCGKLLIEATVGEHLLR